MGFPVLNNTLGIRPLSDVRNRIISRNSCGKNIKYGCIAKLDLHARPFRLLDGEAIHRALLLGKEIGFPFPNTKQTTKQISHSFMR